MRRPNYNAAKRARELKQKAKRDAKLARRQSRAGAPQSDDSGASSEVMPPGMPSTTPDAERDRDPLTRQEE